MSANKNSSQTIYAAGNEHLIKNFSVDEKISYVSLGDSIAAGHALDSWLNNGKKEFGDAGLNSTPIYNESYTQAIYNNLVSIYGSDKVEAVSYARSGDQVCHLLSKLADDRVVNSLKSADIVTISIGANNILTPALERIEGFLTGSVSLAEITGAMEEGIKSLTDGNGDDLTDLLDRLIEINPNAKYIFTNVYNPYKYFDVDIEVFLDPILPEPFTVGYPPLTYEVDIASFIDDAVLDSIESRIDNIREYTEYYLAGYSRLSIKGLNPIVKSTIEDYQSRGYTNFTVVDTKSVFDTFPTKSSTGADVDYSDLVNVELTPESRITEFNYGKHFNSDYWLNWGSKIFFQGVSESEFVQDMVSKVIDIVLEDTDPHPEWRGHALIAEVLKNVVSAIKLNVDQNNQFGIIAIDNQNISLPTLTQNEKIFSGWYKDENLTTKWDNETDKAQGSAQTINFGNTTNGNSIKTNSVKTINLYAEWKELEFDGNQSQKLLLIKNASEVILKVDVDEENRYFEWFDNGKKISNQKTSTLQYTPKTFGKHTICCMVDGVETNSIEFNYERDIDLISEKYPTSKSVDVLDKLWNYIRNIKFVKKIIKKVF